MGSLTILVTGAGGYLGRAAVAAALARGHRVRALARRDGPAPAGAESVRADLVEADLRPILDGVEAVIHCAARMTGTEAQMQRDTVGGTAALIAALPPATGLVLVSSLAVYDAAGLRPGALLDELVPLEPQPALRDAYTRAKLAQEATLTGRGAHVLRPGIVWGPGRLDNPHLGLRLGPLLLRAGAGELPLAHVTHVAEALVLAAERPAPQSPLPLNIVDDDRPTRAAWLTALGQRALTLPWGVLDAMAGVLSPLAPRLPGLLRRPTLRARLMPLRYSNARAKAALGWQPAMSFAEAMRRAR